MDKIKELCVKYREMIAYLIVGVLTTVVALAVYYILVFTFLDPNNSIQLQIANIISWIAGVIFAYFTNRKFVFQSKDPDMKKEFLKFTAARLSTLVMDMVVMFVLVTWLGFNDKICKIISNVLVIIANYVFSKLFVFKKAEKV